MSQFNYYDNIAAIYDQTRWMSESVAEEVADYILELVNAKPDTSFLEPGVGTGLNVLPLVKRGYSVTGIDISQEMLDQFSHKLKGNPENSDSDPGRCIPTSLARRQFRCCPYGSYGAYRLSLAEILR